MGPKLEDFDVVNVVGTGTSGTVRKVRRRSDGKVLVWKELHYANMSEAEKQGLVQEVNLLRELRHPHIVRFLQHIVDRRSATLYIIMEHCPGGDLRRLISRCRTNGAYLEETFIWKILKQLSEALRACHTGRRLVLHRDIKPANVFLDQHANAKLGDFGLARTLSSHASFATSFVGTPYYMSPEVVDGREYNEKSDMWSLGCLLYELCALQPPFQGTSHQQLAGKIRAAKYERIPPQYSDDLWEVIQLLLTHEDFLRPTALMVLYHRALQSRTSPSVGTSAHAAPSPVRGTNSNARLRHAQQQPRSDGVPNQRINSSTVEQSRATATTATDTPTSHLNSTAGGGHSNKMRKEETRYEDGGCPGQVGKGQATANSGEVFVLRRARKTSCDKESLSNISEGEDGGDRKCTADLSDDTVYGTPPSSSAARGGNKTTSSGEKYLDEDDQEHNVNDPLEDSLCPRVLLAARDRAMAAAIAQQNEGTRTMSRDEIDAVQVGMKTPSVYNDKMDCILSSVIKMQGKDNKCKGNLSKPTSFEDVNDHNSSLEDDDRSSSNSSIISVRSIKTKHDPKLIRDNNRTYNKAMANDNVNDRIVLPKDCKTSSPVSASTVPMRAELRSSELVNPSVISTEESIVDAFTTPLPRSPTVIASARNHTPKYTTKVAPVPGCRTSPQTNITKEEQTKLLQTSFESMNHQPNLNSKSPNEERPVFDFSADALQHYEMNTLAGQPATESLHRLRTEDTNGSPLLGPEKAGAKPGECCACRGVSKKEWRARLATLREAELAIRERERDMEERERETSKREKRALAMEQDARQHLVRAQIFLRQARGNNGGCLKDSDQSSTAVEASSSPPPLVSPASAFRYSALWSDTTTVSADPNDSSVVFTAARPDPSHLAPSRGGDVHYNPFLQLRGRVPSNSDPCVADISMREEAAASVFQRVPSVPANTRKAGHEAPSALVDGATLRERNRSYTLDGVTAKIRKKTLSSVTFDAQTLVCDAKHSVQPKIGGNGVQTEQQKPAPLKVRSSNIFSSFRSVNKDAKEKTTKSTSFRIPLLPSRKSLKKTVSGGRKVNSNPSLDKENASALLEHQPSLKKGGLGRTGKVQVYAI